MRSEIGLLCSLCGLSDSAAAEFLGVRIDTLRSWIKGRRGHPPEPVERLRKLWRRIEAAADESLTIWREHAPPGAVFEMGYAADDHEARSMGWPCVGAQRAALGLIIARLPGGTLVELAPRGSTVGTAKAADAREKL